MYRVATALESPVRFGYGGLVDQLARVSPETATVGYLRTCSASPCGVNSLGEQLSGCALGRA
jgi:hypothetical protein